MYKDRFTCYIFGIDDALIGALVAGGSSLLGGVLTNSAQDNRQQQTIAANQASQAESERFNAEQSGITREFNDAEMKQAQSYNATQAEVQRNWLQSMSSTAYQRQMADMRAAGLNPILAAGSGGGASTPGGSSASSGAASAGAASVGAMSTPAPPRPENVIGNAVSSALEANRLFTGNKLTSAQTEKTQADTESSKWDSRIKEVTEEKTKNENSIAANQAKITARQIENQDTLNARQKEQLEVDRANAIDAKNTAALRSTAIGRAAQQAGTLAGDINPVVNTAKGVIGAVRGAQHVVRDPWVLNDRFYGGP